MRQQLQPPAEKTPHVRLPNLRLCAQRPIAQVKHLAGIDLARQQPLLRQTHTGHTGNLLLPHPLPFCAHVNQQAGLFLHRGDDERQSGPHRDAFAGSELHPFQHRGAERIEPLLPDPRKLHAHPASRPINTRNDAEPQLRFSLTHAPLSDHIDFHTK